MRIPYINSINLLEINRKRDTRLSNMVNDSKLADLSLVTKSPHLNKEPTLTKGYGIPPMGVAAKYTSTSQKFSQFSNIPFYLLYFILIFYLSSFSFHLLAKISLQSKTPHFPLYKYSLRSYNSSNNQNRKTLYELQPTRFKQQTQTGSQVISIRHVPARHLRSLQPKPQFLVSNNHQSTIPTRSHQTSNRAGRQNVG